MNRLFYFLLAIFSVFLIVIAYPKNLLDNVVNFSITIQDEEVEEVGEVESRTYGGGALLSSSSLPVVSEVEEILFGDEMLGSDPDLKDSSYDIRTEQSVGSDNAYIYDVFGGIDLFPKEDVSIVQSGDDMVVSDQVTQVSTYDKFYLEWVNLDSRPTATVLFTYAFDRETVDSSVIFKKRLLYSVTGAGCSIFSLSLFLTFIQGISFKQLLIGVMRIVR